MEKKSDVILTVAEVNSVDEVIGKTLIDVTVNPAEGADGVEVVLHFTEGKEIQVMVRNDGTLLVEGD